VFPSLLAVWLVAGCGLLVAGYCLLLSALLVRPVACCLVVAGCGLLVAACCFCYRSLFPLFRMFG